MKRILFLILIGLSSNIIFAQDIIIKHNSGRYSKTYVSLTKAFYSKDLEYEIAKSQEKKGNC